MLSLTSMENIEKSSSTLAAPNGHLSPVIPHNGTYKCIVGPKPINKVGDVVLGIVWWHIPKELAGKVVVITTDTDGHCDMTVEIWTGYISMNETEWWVKNAPLIAGSQHGRNPMLVWRMIPGNCTLVFAHWPYSCGCKKFRIEITYNVTILEKGEWYNWMANLQNPNVKIKLSQMPKNVIKKGRVALLINPSDYQRLREWIHTYITDAYFKYGVNISLYVRDFKDIHEVRGFLRRLYFNNSNLIRGAILVGNLPFPIMGNKTYAYYSTRYYEDLDGYFEFNEDGWIEWWNNTNGIEIWVAIIRPPSAFPIESLRWYFNKLHMYYTGLLRVERRALIAVDHSWRGATANLADEVLTVYKSYDNITVMGGLKGEYAIHGMEFMYYLQSGYKITAGWIHGGFSFEAGGGDVFEGKNHEGSRKLKLGSIIFFMSTCGFTNYNESYCHALSFIIGEGVTLVAIGPTKSEGILESWTFFWKLGEGYDVGDSFLFWLNYRFTDDPWTKQSRFYIHSLTHSWGLGVVIYGDPLLRFAGKNLYFEGRILKVVDNQVWTRIVDEGGCPVGSLNISLSIQVNGTWINVGNAITDSNGIARFRVPHLETGVYNASLYFRGNKEYRPSLFYAYLFVNCDPEYRKGEIPVVKRISKTFEVMRIREKNKRVDLPFLVIEATTEGTAKSVILSYALNGSGRFFKSMIKVDDGKYITYILGNENTKISYEIIFMDKYLIEYVSGKETLIFRRAKESSWSRLILPGLIIVMLIVLLILAGFLQRRMHR